LRLNRAPILLGRGVPLFAGEGPAQPMRLTDHKIYESGAMYLEYKL
jgi:hypothetical protein